MTAGLAGSSWAREVVFDSLGVICSVRTTDDEFGAVVDHLTRDFPPSTGEPEATFSVIRDGDRYQPFDRDWVRWRTGTVMRC